MEAWKETLADTMTAWDYRTEKNFWSDNKYYIRVACTSPGVTDTCRSTMQANMRSLCSDFKGMESVDSSHFDVRVGSSQAQDELHQRLNNLVTEVASYRAKAGTKAGAETENRIKNRNKIAVVAALALATVIIWSLWKK